MNTSVRELGAGLFGSLAQVSEPVALELEGTLPAWLRGTLFRNGPADFAPGDRPVEHWFDGLAVLHRLSFADSGIEYASRALRSDIRDEADRGRARHRAFATDPCWGLFGRLRAAFAPVTDNANIAIGKIGPHVAALSETTLPIRFDPRTLETGGQIPFDDLASMHRRSTTVHPVATADGSLSYLLRFGARSFYEVFRSRGARREVIARIPVKRPAYLHSFAATATRAVLVECPFVVSPLDLFVSGKPFIENFSWRPGLGTTYHLVDLADGRVRSVRGEAMFVFHHVRARDDGDDVLIDSVAYDDPSIIGRLGLESLVSAREPFPPGHLRTVRIGADGAREESRSEAVLELPIVGGRRPGEGRFLYADELVDPSAAFLDGVVKLDFQSERSRRWAEPGAFPGEPVFVPAPGASADDDGVVLVVSTTPTGSFLSVLRGETLEEVARATLPQRIPPGMHGLFDPASPST